MRHHKAGDLNAAEEIYRRLLFLDPNHSAALHLLGLISLQRGQHPAAIDLIGRSLAVKADNAEALNDLGIAFWNLDRLEQAVASYRKSLAVRPDYAEAHNNLGTALEASGKPSDAIACYRRALAARPDYAEAHYNLGMALLSTGDFIPGFAEYEWRWKVAEFAAANPRPQLTQPFWDGSPLGGRTILLHAEQGGGDTIMFIRYASLLARGGGRVVVAGPAELKRLMAAAAGVTRAAGWDEPLPAHDVHAPLLSLPRILKTTAAAVPATIPCFTVPGTPGLPGAPESVLKIGLAWSGHPDHPRDRFRSCPPSCLLPLLKIPGTAWYSLQKGPRAADLGLLAHGGDLRDLSGVLDDFVDTAAVMTQLDLIVSVGTGVAHLSGAVGRPTWVLLPFATDWRWGHQREDSPWYPSMRLFRQHEPGDWPGVIARVGAALRVLMKDKPPKKKRAATPAPSRRPRGRRA